MSFWTHMLDEAMSDKTTSLSESDDPQAKLYDNPYDIVVSHQDDILKVLNDTSYSDEELDKMASWVKKNCKASDKKYQDKFTSKDKIKKMLKDIDLA